MKDFFIIAIGLICVIGLACAALLVLLIFFSVPAIIGLALFIGR